MIIELQGLCCKLVFAERRLREHEYRAASHARETVDAVYRAHSRAVLATLIRLLGDFDLAEEALHEAFRAALEQWPRDGVPANPRAWLVSAGRFKAIDAIRRRARLDPSKPRSPSGSRRSKATAELETGSSRTTGCGLIFTCCHPALPPDAQVALTLREVCGLTTEEIAASVSHAGTDACAAHRASEGQDSRRAHSLRGARRIRIAGATRERAARHLPRVQRRLFAPRPARR